MIRVSGDTETTSLLSDSLLSEVAYPFTASVSRRSESRISLHDDKLEEEFKSLFCWQVFSQHQCVALRLDERQALKLTYVAFSGCGVQTPVLSWLDIVCSEAPGLAHWISNTGRMGSAGCFERSYMPFGVVLIAVFRVGFPEQAISASSALSSQVHVLSWSRC